LSRLLRGGIEGNERLTGASALVRAGADCVRLSDGMWLRQLAVAGALVTGLIVAIVALPAAHDWAHWAALHHRGDH